MLKAMNIMTMAAILLVMMIDKYIEDDVFDNSNCMC